MVSTAIAVLTALSAPRAAAETIDFSYAKSGQTAVMGTGKVENYDVAVHLPGEGYAGSKIIDIKVPVPDNSHITATSVWLSGELSLDAAKNNAPDVAAYPVTAADGYLYVRLPEAYTVPAAGVYVGYSLSVDSVCDATRKPIIGTTDADPEGFYIHSSRLYRNWSSQAVALGFNSGLRMTLEGQFGGESVSVRDIPTYRVDINTAGTLQFTVANFGTSAVENLEVRYSVAGQQKTLTLQPDAVIPASLNMTGTVSLPLDPIDVQGTQLIAIEVLKVNGLDNTNPSPSATGRIKVIPYHPKHTALTEEYGGSWCAWCVRGMAGMQRMTNLYGEEYVAVSYHTRDRMATVPDTEFPNKVDSYPTAYLDRELKVDPYEGLSDGGFHFPEVWQAQQQKYAPAAIEAVAEWTADSCLRVTATLEFVEEPEQGEYVMGYILAHDGMTDPMTNGVSSTSWNQKNAYAGDDPTQYEPELAYFCTQPSSIPNYVYNDVVVQAPHPYGIEGSLDGVRPFEAFSTEYTFTDIFTRNGKPTIVQDGNKLFAVALLIDRKSRRVLNCARARVPGYNSVSETTVPEVVSTRWYDLQGRAVAAPTHGIYLRIDTVPDGRTRTAKVVM